MSENYFKSEEMRKVYKELATEQKKEIDLLKRRVETL